MKGVVSSAVLLSALASCNPVDTYRHWTGISANDPNPATTPNTKNLAAGEARSYPNLATVPPPPTQALTTAELDKLTQSLIADRANAKYTSEHLDTQPEGAVPPPPPAPLLPPPTPGAAQPGAPGAATPGSTSSGPSPAVATPAPAPAGSAKPAPAGPGGGASAPSASVGPPTKGARKPGQPPEPGPMESSLQSPQIASLPQAQQNQPMPPAPHELSMPAASGTAKATAGAHLPAAPAPEPMPAAIGSAQFQPAPPPPTLAPVAPIRTATATAAGKPPKPGPPPVTFDKVADIAFPGDKTNLSEADLQALDKMLPRYRTKPGLVRVVGYAGIGASASEQLNSYRTALDRAQAVAKGLAQAGIPANKIAVEAAPTGADAGPGRAEILFEQ